MQSNATTGPRCARERVCGARVLVLGALLACGKPPAEDHRIEATVNGLLGTGFVLQLNGRDDVAVTADGRWTLANMTTGSSYAVTIKTQPVNPAQICTVAGGSGTVGDFDLATVAINGGLDRCPVGGTVAGLRESGLVLHNGSEDLGITANGTFGFSTPVGSGASFDVMVVGTPPTEACSVSNGAGVVNAADVTSVDVACACRPGRTDCDGSNANGCETQIDTDPANCGTCGHVCAVPPHATAACHAGACAIGACSAGFLDCNGVVADGCETNPSADTANCGVCGHICDPGLVCSLGTCVAARSCLPYGGVCTGDWDCCSRQCDSGGVGCFG